MKPTAEGYGLADGQAWRARLFKKIGMISDDAQASWPCPTPFLPSFRFYEVHESGVLAASSEAIVAAVCATDMRDDRVTQVLLSLRELPSALAHVLRRDRQRGLTPRFGFDSFTPLSRTSQEVSMGLVGRFWRPDGGLVRVSSADDFMRVTDPSLAKLVLRFAVIDDGGGRRLRTETFVHCSTRQTRWLFTPYWLLIRVASGWIRRRMLASVTRRLAVGG